MSLRGGDEVLVTGVQIIVRPVTVTFRYVLTLNNPSPSAPQSFRTIPEVPNTPSFRTVRPSPLDRIIFETIPSPDGGSDRAVLGEPDNSAVKLESTTRLLTTVLS